MEIRKLEFYVTILLFLYLPGLHAQEVVSAAGNDATGNGGSMSFSTGQVVFTTNTGISGSLAQGVQQPYEISVVTEIPDGPDVRLNFTTYPNPTNHFLTLRFGGALGSEYQASLYDANGRLCVEETVTSNETLFDLSNFVTGTYFLKLRQLKREIKTFKIIKN